MDVTDVEEEGHDPTVVSRGFRRARSAHRARGTTDSQRTPGLLRGTSGPSKATTSANSCPQCCVPSPRTKRSPQKTPTETANSGAVARCKGSPSPMSSRPITLHLVSSGTRWSSGPRNQHTSCCKQAANFGTSFTPRRAQSQSDTPRQRAASRPSAPAFDTDSSKNTAQCNGYGTEQRPRAGTNPRIRYTEIVPSTVGRRGRMVRSTSGTPATNPGFRACCPRIAVDMAPE